MMKNAKSLPSETIFSGGAMAEWLGRALQKLARRFDSGSCLQISLFQAFSKILRISLIN